MITEFGLSAPALPKHLKSEFSYQTRSLTSLYQRVFGKWLKVGKAWKFLVEVVPRVERPEFRDLLGVIAIQVADDPISLLDAPDAEKSKLALDWLMRGLIEIAHQLDLDSVPFCAAAEKVRLENYVNTYSWKNAIVSKSREKSAELIVDHGIHQARIFGRVLARDGALIREELLITTRPDELIFVPLLGEFIWNGESEVVLHSKTGEVISSMSAVTAVTAE